jgi:hypothetical protein
MRTILIAFLCLPLAVVLGFECHYLAERETTALREKPLAPKELQNQLDKGRSAAGSFTEELHAGAVFVMHKKPVSKAQMDEKEVVRLADAFNEHSKELVTALKNVDALRTQSPMNLRKEYQDLWDALHGPEKMLEEFKTTLKAADRDTHGLADQWKTCFENWKKLNDSKETIKRAKQVVVFLNNAQKAVRLIAEKNFSDKDFQTLADAAKEEPLLLPLAKNLALEHINSYWCAQKLELDTKVKLRIEGAWDTRGLDTIQVEKEKRWLYLNKQPELQFEVLPVQREGSGRVTERAEYKNMLCPTSKSIVAYAYNTIVLGPSKSPDNNVMLERLWKECASLAYRDADLKANIENERIQFVIQELQKHKDTAPWGRKLDAMTKILKSCPALFP